MKQAEFYKRLSRALSRLPEVERQEIITDYQEYIHDALEAGREEEQVIAALGSPEKLAKELLARHHLDQWEQRKSFGNLLSVVGAIAGLGVINFMLAIPFLIYLAIVTSGMFVASMLLISGVLVTSLSISHGLLGWPVLNRLETLEVVNQQTGDVHTKLMQGVPQINISGENGEKVDIHRDASSGKTIVNIQSSDSAVHIEGGLHESRKLILSDKNGSVRLNGLLHSPSGWSMFFFGVVLLLIGGGGVLIGWLLLRWTWRCLVTYGRYQLSLLDKVGHTQS